MSFLMKLFPGYLERDGGKEKKIDNAARILSSVSREREGTVFQGKNKKTLTYVVVFDNIRLLRR